MSARKLDGAAVAAAIRQETAAAVRELGGAPPGLAVILAGDNPASQVYVRNKTRACGEAGLRSETLRFGLDATTAELLAAVQGLNARADVDGILVQLPLPAGVDTAAVLDAVAPDKDVDGFHPVNLGRLLSGRPGPRPCTPAGIMELLRRDRIELAGKRAVVLGRSEIVGKPMALLLLAANATVTVCHSRTRDLAAVCREAEILVAAIGRPGLVGRGHIAPGAVVIDVGINRIATRAEVERFFPGDAARLAEWESKGGTLVGDVDPTAVRELAAAYTPVPGGVGPLTIAMLLANTVAAAGRAVLKVVLTGGLCSGKSTVAAMLRERGWPVLDADAIGHDLLTERGEASREVLAAFGTLDRVALAARVFGDETARRRLNAILHPRIRREIARRLRELDASGVPIAAAEIALYYETGAQPGWDKAIAVICDRETRLRRCLGRSGLGRESAEARLATQWPDAERARRADFTVDNSGPIAATRRQVESIVATILRELNTQCAKP